MYKMMIVEDEHLVRKGIAALVDFQRFGIELVAEAENGSEAWEIIQTQAIDLVLTDINMPRMNGIRLAQLIKDHRPDIHIVFLTGYDAFEYALSAVKLGIDDYLLKPFSREDVEEMLGKIVAKLDQEGRQQQIRDLMQSNEVSRLEKAIQDRLSDSNLTLKSLAQDLGFSPSYLSVLLKKELGVSFQEYMIQERMKMAKLLLLTTDLKIYEIANEVGFEDMNYFSYRFKQMVGISPRQFKKGEHA